MKLRLAKPAREAIGARLREVRRFHTLEQTELANMAGLSQAIISQYEKGLTEVSLSFITFLSEKFGISIEWLVSGKPTARFLDTQTKSSRARRRDETTDSAEKKGASRFIQVPIVSPAVAARPGAVRDDTIQGWQPAPAGLHSHRKNLVAVDIKTAWVKSMGSVFRPAGRVIIDRDDKIIGGNHYYAVNEHPEQGASITAIRRLNQSGSRLWFLEDHPTGSFAHVDLSPRLTIDRAVIGHLVWICQPL